MRNQILSTLILLSFFPISLFAVGGDMGTSTEPLTEGSEGYPYLIEDFLDFQTFCNDSNYWASGVHIRLEADLDLDPSLPGREVYIQAPIAGDENIDMNYDGISYSGTFDGNGNNIDNLTINGYSNAGLFGSLTSDGTIINLNTRNVSIDCSGYTAGGLLGHNNRGSISNCSSSGSVHAQGNVGGLLGGNVWGDISDSHSSAEVSGNSYIGGLVGNTIQCTLKNCYSTGNISGDHFIGGLIGESQYCTLLSCYSTSQVSGNYGVGGLLGQIRDSYITNCNSRGTVTSSGFAGGLIGYNDDSNITNCVSSSSVICTENYQTIGGLIGLNGSSSSPSKANIFNCFSSGTVTGTSTVGGLVGNNYGTIYKCHSNNEIESSGYAGGIVARNFGSITNSFSNCTVLSTGKSSLGGCVGYNNGMIINCYSTEMVTGSGTSKIGGFCGNNGTEGVIEKCYSIGNISYTSTGGDVGGFVGVSSGDINTSFWDIDASGIGITGENNYGAIGNTTSQLQLQSTFTNVGWDFDNNVGDLADWTIIDGNNYPDLVLVPLNGSGSEEDPYKIETIKDFHVFCAEQICWKLGIHTKLINDLDLDPDLQNSQLYTQAPIASYSGIFNGNENTIRNLTINGTDYCGLFGSTGGSEISNLTVQDVYINCSGDYAGGLTGYNSGKITNCHSTGTIISDSDTIGGLVGYHTWEEIINCSSSVIISGDNSVGGLVGYTRSGDITDCHSSGSTTGNKYIGGLVGSNYANITQCSSSAETNGSQYAGGLIGYNYYSIYDTTVSESYSSGIITGISFVGGLIGYNVNKVNNCYSSSTVNGTSFVGGFAGFQNEDAGGVISNCYSIGLVSGDNEVGGFLGYNESFVVDCYWDAETSNQLTSSGGLSRTTEQMKEAANYLGWNNGKWTIDQGVLYPRLSWENGTGLPITTDYPAATYTGSGIETDPYIIETITDLLCMAQRVQDWNRYFILINDIDLTGISHTPISMFSGTFDGKNHAIYNLTIDSEAIGNRDQLGFFGKITYPAKIMNININACNISGQNGLGGLIGDSNGENEIINCHVDGNINGKDSVGLVVGDLGVFTKVTGCDSSGSVSGDYYIGGIVGNNGYGGILINCFSDAEVIGDQYVSGIIGYGSGSVSYCNFSGSATGNKSVGGLAGVNGGTVSNSKSSGAIIGRERDTGGLVGECHPNCTIINSYATGSVKGNRKLGGIVGWNSGSTINCYSTVKVEGSSTLGGLCGGNDGDFIGCFWDVETSRLTEGVGNEHPDPVGVIGGISSELKTLSTFTDSGWDFTNESINGTDNYWRMCADGIDYPQLNWEFIDGDLACPIRVDIEDIDYFTGQWMLNDCTEENNYCSGADINFSGSVDLADWCDLAANWLND